MEEELRAVLLADGGVSGRAGGRVNWGAHPQGAPWPGCVLTGVSDLGGHTLDGPTGVFAARVQIDCYAGTYGAAKQLSRAVRACLDGHSGGILQGVFLAGARDGREGGTNEADRPFRVSLDFMVHYEEL
ncbi:DUF3168 domain-containing protein [Mesobaculum littorinae]|uniref:DUF3168 domain-containing protein n=1 Tax=Mesobaculum littorinae TaxID=2486419 RepID=A0A438ALZ1_9RHOB|nr:DUF3168 domain-containing protein [Mesobaculum littorinae]RVV99702.1 DUF3168 domain-containing protein [Mesobaculum littorinae]